MLPAIVGSDHGIIPDHRDDEILIAFTSRWNLRKEIRVGDFIKFLDGTYGRFTHACPDGLQTTVRSGEFGEGSFHMTYNALSYSGALDPIIKREKIRATDRLQAGRAWFFHHGFGRAHSAVYATVPCRVYEELP